MSAKIRLRRMGKKKQPHYRIVVADGRSPRDGRFVENLGYYHPIPQPARISVDLERVDYWLGEGAQASPTVASLLSKARAGGDDKVALAGTVVEVAEAEAKTNGAATDGDQATEAEAKAAEAEAKADDQPEASDVDADAGGKAEAAESDVDADAAPESSPEDAPAT